MISAAMPELQLSGIGADSARKELMSEANSKVRHVGIERGTDDIQTAIKIFRIARSWRYDDPIRIQHIDVSIRSAIWNDGDHGSPVDE